MMRLGLALPHYPFSFPRPTEQPIAQRALAYAQRAEELGFHQVWVSDHLFLNVAPPGKPEHREVPVECWTLLAAIAATTSRIRLGSLATPVGFRNPNLFAHMVATVSQLSAGRLDVTLGAGWNEAEYRECGLPFGTAPERLGELARAVQSLRRQCAGVPVWVGGKRPRLLAVAATADGWNTAWDCAPEHYQHRKGVLELACRRNGRDPNTVRRTIGLTTLIGHSAEDLADRWRRLQQWAPGGALDGIALRDWARTRLVGTPEEIRKQLHEWRRTGVEQVVCAFGAPFAITDDEQLEIAAATMS